VSNGNLIAIDVTPIAIDTWRGIRFFVGVFSDRAGFDVVFLQWQGRRKSPMRWGQFLLCGWPGLAHLWLRGSYPALGLAIGFAMMLNLALMATFLWPALLGDVFPAIAWPVVCFTWLTSTATALRAVQHLSVPPKMSCQREQDGIPEEKINKIGWTEPDQTREAASHTLFNRAQREYLMGHWSEATILLRRRLDQTERDVEARLLLATLYRRTGKLVLATEELKQMERFDDAVHWAFEIGRERGLIEEALEDGNSVAVPEQGSL
jgi:hypothetical protein